MTVEAAGQPGPDAGMDQPETALYTAERLDVLLELAELPLSPQRKEKLIETLPDLDQKVAKIRSVALGETPPATAFDARWS